MQLSSLHVTLCAHPIAHALWKRLDTPGHDAAFLFETDGGYELRGTAIFKADAGPARIAYRVELDRAWRARAGQVGGEIGETVVAHRMEHLQAGWLLDGHPVAGLSHLQDLDFGFTPATNMPALRRAALNVGQAADMPAAWFDLGPPRLTALPQHYRRIADAQYDYHSPTADYRAVLELAPSGFVRVYPGLWEMA
jgi:hypothetical protein